jgi:hypothetical protein
MKKLLFYNSYDIFLNRANYNKRTMIPGGDNFSSFFHVFNANITVFDRTNTISVPLNVKLLPHLAMPEMVTFDKSWSDICDDRAKEVMNMALSTNRKLAVMYSGGVDSTLILCALLKNIPLDVLKKNVVVLLSDQSIRENANFYYNHVIKHFECVATYRFPYFLGNDDYLFISGENADQLFGSQLVGYFTVNRNFSDVFKDVNELEGPLIDWMRRNFKTKTSSLAETNMSENLLNLMKKFKDTSPIKLDTFYKLFWWINFSTKWQSVYVRILPFANNPKGIKMEENYTTFYHTPEFQLWSMNNADSLIGETADTSKYVAKEYIIDYTGDSEYFKKPKIGSLSRAFLHKDIYTYIDEDMNFVKDYPTEEYYNYGNDFERMIVK